MSAAQAGASSAADVAAAANLPRCAWFVWQGFGSDGATAVAPVRCFQKFPSCLTKQMLGFISHYLTVILLVIN